MRAARAGVQRRTASMGRAKDVLASMGRSKDVIEPPSSAEWPALSPTSRTVPLKTGYASVAKKGVATAAAAKVKETAKEPIPPVPAPTAAAEKRPTPPAVPKAAALTENGPVPETARSQTATEQPDSAAAEIAPPATEEAQQPPTEQPAPTEPPPQQTSTTVPNGTSETPLPIFSHRTPIKGHFSHPPNVAYTTNPSEVEDLIGCLRGPLSLDLEWPPPGQGKAIPRKLRGGKIVHIRRPVYDQKLGKNVWPEAPVTVIQIADSKLVIVFQMLHDPTIHVRARTEGRNLTMPHSMPPALLRLLADPERVKCGVNIKQDGNKLWRDFGVPCAGLLELSAVARHVDGARWPSKGLISLARLSAAYLGAELEKGAVRTGDWSARLDEEQVAYAADDAFAGRLIYDALLKRGRETDTTLYIGNMCASVGCEPAPQKRNAQGPTNLKPTAEPYQPKNGVATSPKAVNLSPKAATLSPSTSPRLSPRATPFTPHIPGAQVQTAYAPRPGPSSPSTSPYEQRFPQHQINSHQPHPHQHQHQHQHQHAHYPVQHQLHHHHHHSQPPLPHGGMHPPSPNYPRYAPLAPHGPPHPSHPHPTHPHPHPSHPHPHPSHSPQSRPLQFPHLPIPSSANIQQKPLTAFNLFESGSSVSDISARFRLHHRATQTLVLDGASRCATLSATLQERLRGEINEHDTIWKNYAVLRCIVWDGAGAQAGVEAES